MKYRIPYLGDVLLSVELVVDGLTVSMVHDNHVRGEFIFDDIDELGNFQESLYTEYDRLINEEHDDETEPEAE